VANGDREHSAGNDWNVGLNPTGGPARDIPTITDAASAAPRRDRHLAHTRRDRERIVRDKRLGARGRPIDRDQRTRRHQQPGNDP
jgi:hypothetical protein